MAWVALFSACVWLFLRIAVRTAALFHHLILTTTLKYGIPPIQALFALANSALVPEWISSPRRIVESR